VPTSTPTPVPTATPTPSASIELIKEGVFTPGSSDPWAECLVFGPAANFNAIIFGDFTASGGDTDGRLGVQGNASIPASYSVGQVIKGHPIPDLIGSAVDMLIVQGDFEDGTWGVNGNIVVGGTRTGPYRWMANGNMVRQVSPITLDDDGNVPADGSGQKFNQWKGRLKARSATLANMTPTGTVDASETYELLLTGLEPGLNIFAVTAAQWNRPSQEIVIDAPADSTVLINVTGTTIHRVNGSMRLVGVDHEHVLVNYPNATDITMSGFLHEASFMAMSAQNTAFSGGSIDGRAVISGTVTSENGFEFHNFYFDGVICLSGSGGGTAAEPPHIDYTFTVENTGEVDLSNILIIDPSVDVDGTLALLPAGTTDTTSFTATYYPSQSEIDSGEFVNIAKAYGTTPNGQQVTSTDTHVLTFPFTPAPTPAPTPVATPAGWMKPDFEVTSITLSPEPGTVNQAFSAEVVITNIGFRDGDASTLRIWPDYLSGGSSDISTGSLQVGESATYMIDGLTSGPTARYTHVRVEIDADDDVVEAAEGNNHNMSYYSMVSAEMAKPDFIVQSVTLDPSPAVAGSEFDAVIQVKNQGPVAGDAGVLAVWGANDRYTSAPSLAADKTTEVGVLGPDETKEIRVSDLTAPGTEGTYHAMAVVNATGVSTESSYGNNHVGSTYTLERLNITITPTLAGMKLSWNGSPGYYYFVERADSLLDPFVMIGDNLPATPPKNAYIDTTPSPGVAIYRVWGWRP
jgi:choice-of-anchor A domain-containing protein